MALSDAAPFAVAAWDLDEASGTRVDQVGSNDLTDNNTVASAAGMFGNAADFEVDNGEFLSIADNADVSAGDITFFLRAWVKLESKLDNYIIIGKDNNVSGDREFNLFYRSGTDRFAFELFEPTDSGTILEANNLGSPSTGVWYLLHAWYDSTANTMNIAVNAGTADSTSKAALQASGGAEFRIGARQYSGFNNFFDGLIDDVVLLKNYILDATERTEDYNGGAGVPFSRWTDDLADAAPSAVANWKLDETSGTRFDSVGSNDLADNNTVASATGMFGNAADFEASNLEYLSITDNTDLSAGDIDILFRWWMKLETSANVQVFSKDNEGGQREYGAYTTGGSVLRFYIFDPSNNFVEVGAATFGALSTGVWYLVHAWHDSVSNRIGISINGGVADTVSHSAGVKDGTADFWIGRLGTTYYDGLIDDVVLIKNYILTSGQRALDYNSGAGVAYADWAGAPAGTITLDEDGLIYQSVTIW